MVTPKNGDYDAISVRERSRPAPHSKVESPHISGRVFILYLMAFRDGTKYYPVSVV